MYEGYTKKCPVFLNFHIFSCKQRKKKEATGFLLRSSDGNKILHKNNV